MELSMIQIILLVILAFLIPIDKYGMTFGLRWPVITGFLAGLILGDLKTCLFVGGTLQLMSLGVAPIGGSSIPEYAVGAIIASTLAVTTGQGVEAGLAIGLPVAMLGVQFDVIAKISQSLVVKTAQNFCNNKNFKAMYSILMCGPLIMGLTAAIPVALCLLISPQLVSDILAALPSWFTGGLSIAAKMLPVVGIAILLEVMPTKKYFVAIVLGYFLVAYLNVPMLGVAIVGGIIAATFYQMKSNTVIATVDEGGIGDE